PEEALIASLSSCHMLWFLALAAKRGLVIESYSDQAFGVLDKDAQGRISMTRITLRPIVRFSGPAPDPSVFTELHHEAHDRCYIANTVRSEVTCDPRIA